MKKKEVGAWCKAGAASARFCQLSLVACWRAFSHLDCRVHMLIVISVLLNHARCISYLIHKRTCYISCVCVCVFAVSFTVMVMLRENISDPTDGWKIHSINLCHNKTLWQSVFACTASQNWGNSSFIIIGLLTLKYVYPIRARAHTHTHTHPFNGPFPGLPWSAGTRKVRPIWIILKQDSERQWHQLGHMQVCTLLQADNHSSTAPLSFLQTGCPSCRPTNSVKALKAEPWRSNTEVKINVKS